LPINRMSSRIRTLDFNNRLKHLMVRCSRAQHNSKSSLKKRKESNLRVPKKILPEMAVMSIEAKSLLMKSRNKR
jgi:hypothetical protein